MKPVVCIGELLIDFVCTDYDKLLSEGVNFVKKAGGAPANVSVAIKRLGGEAAFFGKVGRDPFGDFLEGILEANDVDTSMLIRDEEQSTTMAFVSLKSDGQRDFSFSRGADATLSINELNQKYFNESSIIHFGSATAFLNGSLKETYVRLLKLAKEKNKFVSFDPNYRSAFWEGNHERFKSYCEPFLNLADFIKVSDEEAILITGTNTLDEAVDALMEMTDSIITVTLGKDGVLVAARGTKEVVSSPSIVSVDSTGAGDAFVGGFLYKVSLLDDPFNIRENRDQILEYVSFGAKVGAFTCTKLGAIDALPTLEEVDTLK